MVKIGWPKSAQEIWLCFVRLEGQGASLLALVGSLTCWLLVRSLVPRVSLSLPLDFPREHYARKFEEEGEPCTEPRPPVAFPAVVGQEFS